MNTREVLERRRRTAGRPPDGAAGEPSPPPDGRRGLRLRLIAFAVVVAACGVAALLFATGGSDQPESASADLLARVLGEPHVLMLRSEPDATRPRSLEVAPLDDVAHPLATSLQCQRVAYAGGRGLCLTLGYELDKGSAWIFDEQLEFVTKVPAQGLPSRARVSDDGRWGSMTFFVFGHSYADGSFSTATQIVDMQTGDLAGNIEEWSTFRDGRPWEEEDFNFWGVTFQPGGRFYATLGSGGQTYLVEGDIAARRMDVVDDHVECPSLSPDGKTLVFNVRVEASDSVEWRLWAMDVATGERRQLAETRNVDDQVEWLDDTHILYSPATVVPSVWVLDVTGDAPPTPYAESFVSPIVVA